MTDANHDHHPAPIIRARHLRRNQTSAEGTLWAHLRGRQLNGHKFRRQHPLGNYIVDFCCEARCLVLEIDGDSHAEQEEYDLERTRWLNEHGYRVIRFSNWQVHEHLDAVLEAILRACEGEGGEIPSP